MNITEEERDNVCAFRLRFLANVPRATYNEFRHAFRRKLALNSDWVILHRVAALSGVQAKWYECCINSCICYVDIYSEAVECPECSEPRWSPSRHPRRYFCYIPLIPRLCALFQCIRLIQLMQYRSKFQHNPELILDVFSSEHYQNLKGSPVLVDGEELNHHHFSDPRDIALALCTDAFLLFQRHRSGPSATPLLLLNYNLPPQVRTHLENLICLGVIGGPGQPKRIWTYLVPFEEELAQLAHGVPTFDALSRSFFTLHTYCILCLGDIIAIQKMLNIRGVNAWTPCRSCRIHGILMPGKTNYYIPLNLPQQRGEQRKRWDPASLPLRTHDDILVQLDSMAAATTTAHRRRLGQHHGFRHDDPHCIGPVIGRRVQSTLDYARSFPWDWMHLFCENNIPNLVAMWMGRFSDLRRDEGTGHFIIPGAIWEEIAKETKAAVKDLPAAFVGSIPDIIMQRDKFTADTWAFWFIYIAPIVLRGRFQHEKYYTHMCDLVSIMRRTLQFEVTRTEVEQLRRDIISWVERYEEYYYQYNPQRLSACLMVVHGLLHIVDDILYAGPVWTTWTFFMERFCGSLKRALRSRSHPWANLDRRALNIAHAHQLLVKYDFEDELLPSRKDPDRASENETMIPGCECLLAQIY